VDTDYWAEGLLKKIPFCYKFSAGGLLYQKYDNHSDAKTAARQGKVAVVFALGQTFLYLPLCFEKLMDEDVRRLIGDHFRLSGIEESRFEIVSEAGYCSLDLPTCWRNDWYTFDERPLRSFVSSLTGGFCGLF